ncbi:MAG: hypothetical protein HOU81_09280 [Hamadaea sp.]|uniref:hypothetical protein n=1 Tax=Hamadaea sp. TaxID=2024425 RepID=UPI00182E29E4|nr:hypothetical protein [Hamadaea sp.]NUR71001.1 hypothetical protein [Hamadaea sp.]NUT23682.1 hypothetical protein [Hamadaea sp.]
MPTAPDEPTVPVHGRAAVPTTVQDYPVTAVPYDRPPRRPTVKILTGLVVVLLIALTAVTGYFLSADKAHREREDQLAAQVADGQRKVQELQAQVAAAQADAAKARAENAASGGTDTGKVEQLTSCSDALKSVLSARSGADFSKAYKAMQELCKIAGIPLF